MYVVTYFGKLNMVICYILLLTKCAYYVFSYFARWAIVYLAQFNSDILDSE